MALRIAELKKTDYKKAIQYAIKGMHFEWYLKNKFLLNCYGRYFWYLEMNRATEILAVYDEDNLAGVMLAEMYGETPKHSSFVEKLYVRFIDFVQRTFFKGGADVYEETTKKLLSAYKENHVFPLHFALTPYLPDYILPIFAPVLPTVSPQAVFS